MTNEEYATAYETIIAGLALLRRLAKDAGLPVTALDLLYHAESRIADDAPPWAGEVPDLSATWGQVTAGDQAQAPNGEWYKVDAVARIGQEVRVHLIVNGATVATTQDAGTVVTVRRGPEGRAVDVFAAAGMTLEGIGR